MADTPTAAKGGPVASDADIGRAEAFTREQFVHEGEEAAVALAPGTPRARALTDALAEIEAGEKLPSTQWRRQWSLLLGLERLLSEEEPHLADGTTLNPHQVDALSGTLTALLASQMATAVDGEDDGAAPVFAIEEDEEGETEDEELAAELAALDEEFAEDEEEAEEEEAEEVAEVDPLDDPLVAPEEVDTDIDEAILDDPNAGKRFWFEHATGAGKTVAAMGFVEASRTGGVLILTHRRNLVDQFLGELETRGYADR
ncbi:MAG: DEAD/DEAH box helicase family protein, partial [Solirubrobacterales bacterium]